MLISEAGLVRAMKGAYKGGGYTVVNNGDSVLIFAATWYVECKWNLLPRKVLAIIVEHAGMIPGEDEPVRIMKDTDPQLVMSQSVAESISVWRGGCFNGTATMVPVIMQALQLFQKPGGGPCWGVGLVRLGILEIDNAEHDSALVNEDGRLMWEGYHENEETVVLYAERKTDYRAQPWERDVWAALESVDLHKGEET